MGAKGPLSPQQSAAVLHRLELQSPNPDALAKHLAIEQEVAGGALYTGNQVQVLRDGAQTFPAMRAAILSAKRSLYLEYYIFEDVELDGERLSDLLLARQAAGVQVAVLYDSIGSNATPPALFEQLRSGGISVLEFNPVNPVKSHGHWSINDRDHRKILVADDLVAIVGGINLSSTYESGPSSGSHAAPAKGADEHPYWRDTDLEIKGPASAELSRVFREHWSGQGSPALPEVAVPAPAAGGSAVIRVLGSEPGALAPRYYATVLSAIENAEQRIWITAAYFVPTRQEKSAMIAAARRGVDVTLLVPSKTDSSAALAVQRAAYADLLEAGVKIYERENVILHTKSIVVDSVWTILGSSNFDHRSVLFNDEVDVVILSPTVGRDLESYFVSDIAESKRIDPSTWKHRPLSERVRETFWRVTTTWL